METENGVRKSSSSDLRNLTLCVVSLFPKEEKKEKKNQIESFVSRSMVGELRSVELFKSISCFSFSIFLKKGRRLFRFVG